MTNNLDMGLNRLIRKPKLTIKCYECNNDITIDKITTYNDVNYHFYDCIICNFKYYVGYNVYNGQVNNLDILYKAGKHYRSILNRKIFIW